MSSRSKFVSAGLLCALIATHTEAHALELIVVAAANDYGYGQDVPLRFAESDANRLVATFEEMSGPIRLHSAIGGDAHQLQDMLEQAKQDVIAAKQLGEKSLLIVYYSGHADGDYLRFGNSRMTWAKLKSMIAEMPADLSVSIIDACDSGSATLPKGATYSPPLDDIAVTSRPTRGSMWIASSREDEASYESDELGGSLFSHYFISGLRGAADLDEDGRVTLNEVYQFSYVRTVGETSLNLKQTQHPTFRSELEGEGDVVLSEPKRSPTSIVLPRELTGHWFVSRRFGSNRSVLEIPKAPGALVRMGVPAGTYLVYRKQENNVLLTVMTVDPGEEAVVDPSTLRARPYTALVAKGGSVSLATWQLRAGGGVRAPMLSGANPSFDLGVGMVRRAQSFGLGASLNASTFALSAVDTPVRTFELTAAVFGQMFGDFGWCSLGVEAGPLVVLAHQKTNRDSFQSLSPGLLLSGSIERKMTTSTSLSFDLGVRGLLLNQVDTWSARLVPFAQLRMAFDLD